ncbi:MAG: DUF2723 domain-containing protein [Gemmatimonadota bacterium]|nr:DUF2723 domain-containing protein [Gemmatimonadota bacterium]
MPPSKQTRRAPRRDVPVAPEQNPSYGVAALVSLAIFALYLATLAPNTAMWDTSEYIAAAQVLGIPHPPGNPFFVLIAHVFSILPIGGNAATRINVLAALCSAASAGTWFLVVERVVSQWLPERWMQLGSAAAAALLGATAFTVWNQSVVNEKVYTVSLAFFAIVSWLTVLWCDNPDERTADRLLVLIGFLIALGYTNHPAGFLVAPAVGAAVLFRRPTTLLRWKLLLAIGAAFVVGLTPFLVEPIRAGHFPAINEGEATGCTTKFELSCTFNATARSRLADNINRVQYGKPPLDERQVSFPAQVGMFWMYFEWQWLRDPYGTAPRGLQGLLAGIYLVLGVAGGYAHFKRDRYSFGFFGPLMFTITLALIFYMNFKYGYSQAPELGNTVPREVRDRDYFYLWGFSAWSVWAGLGIVLVWEQLAALLSPESDGVASRIPRRNWLMTTPVFLLALIPLITNWRAASRHGDNFTRDWAADVLNSVEPYGVLITNGDNDTFPLWYAQEVEGVRRDVTVAVTSLLRTDWYVRQMIRRPIYPYDAAKGPIVYRGRQWPLPNGPPVSLTLEQADALPEVMSLPQAQLFKKDSIEAVIPPGDFFKDQIIVLRVIQDGYPNRPLYFTSGSYPRTLGLSKYIANQGLVSKLFPTPIVASKRFVEVPGYGFFDLPRTDSLWSDYKAPAALLKRGEWVDKASSDIPLRYVITAALLSDLTRMQGDSAGAAKYMKTAIDMARAARVESVLGFTKTTPATTEGPERH